jgi:hypothetical protein
VGNGVDTAVDQGRHVNVDEDRAPGERTSREERA